MRLDLNTTLEQAIKTIIGTEERLQYLVDDLYMISSTTDKIDPMCFMRNFLVPLMMDEFEIYEENLERLWTVVCKRNSVLMHTLIRAQQYGLVTRNAIYDSCFKSERLQPCFDFKDLYIKVRENLGADKFDPENRLDVDSIDVLFNTSPPASPAEAVARWWGNTLRGSGKSDAKLETSGPAAMLMGMCAGLKKVDSEDQVKKFEVALAESITFQLGDRRVVYHKTRSRFEPRSKKRRAMKKFYKKEYEKYNTSDYAFIPKLPSYRAMIIGYYRKPVTFGVDYHPDRILSNACEVAGIKCSMLTFPCKTHCRVEQDWAGIANGYGSGMEVIFGTVPERGQRRA